MVESGDSVTYIDADGNEQTGTVSTVGEPVVTVEGEERPLIPFDPDGDEEPPEDQKAADARYNYY